MDVREVLGGFGSFLVAVDADSAGKVWRGVGFELGSGVWFWMDDL
jgi:hypothetical protein